MQVTILMGKPSASVEETLLAGRNTPENQGRHT